MAAGIAAATHTLVTCTSRSSSSLEEPFRRVCTMAAAQRAARGAQARPPASGIHGAAVRQWRAPSECCWFESWAGPQRCSRELCHCLAVSCTRPMMDCTGSGLTCPPCCASALQGDGSVPQQPPGRSTLAGSDHTWCSLPPAAQRSLPGPPAAQLPPSLQPTAPPQPQHRTRHHRCSARAQPCTTVNPLLAAGGGGGSAPPFGVQPS